MFTHLLPALLAASHPIGATPHGSAENTGSVNGAVSVSVGGDPLDCVGALLLPRSPQIDAAIRQKFGELDEGVQTTTRTSFIGSRRSSYPKEGRTARCNGGLVERFTFSDVPAGEYFVTVSAIHRRLDQVSGPHLNKVEMMRRVLVMPGTQINLDFKHKD